MKLLKKLKKIFNTTKEFNVKVGDIIWDSKHKEYVYVVSKIGNIYVMSNFSESYIDGRDAITRRMKQRFYSTSDMKTVKPIVKYNDIVTFILDGKEYHGYFEKYEELIKENYTKIRILNIIKTSIH